MTDSPASQPPGWYYAQGDPPGTQRYWDGAQWQGGPQAVGAQPGGMASAGSNLADGGVRIGARIVDWIVYIIISFIFAAVIGGGAATFGSTDYSFRAALAGFIGGLVIAAIEIYLTANGGQSLGKKALNIKVVKTDGGDVDMETSIRRFSPYLVSAVAGLIPVIGVIISLIIFLIGIVSLVFIFTDGQKQAVWDKIANTLVVKV